MINRHAMIWGGVYFAAAKYDEYQGRQTREIFAGALAGALTGAVAGQAHMRANAHFVGKIVLTV